MTLRRRPTKTILLCLLFLFIAVQAAVTFAFGVPAGLVIAGSLMALAVIAITHMYFTLSAKLDAHAESLANEHIQTTRQVQSLLYVFSVIKPRRPLPPMRHMAISPDFAATLVSLVAELRPKTILEFGSGTSTLLCSYCLEMLGGGSIISVDHEEQYAEQTRQSLRDHGLERFARVIHAPLKEVSFPAGKWQWYNTSFIAELPTIDLLIVDGPPAWLQPMSRYPALPLVFSHLSPSATVLIDDANRTDEQKMLEKWMAEFPAFARSNLMHEKGTVLLKRTATGVRNGAGA
jgi:predicted O-methyltransferase YrrM